MNKTRNRKVTFRLSEEEYNTLSQLIATSRCKSKEEYIRMVLIYNKHPLPDPYKDSQIDFKELTRQIRAIGYNINQIAEVANATDYINEVAYKQNAKKLFAFLRQLERIPKWVKVNDCGFM